METSDDKIPEGIFYHRKCRSVFTLKRDLENIVARDRKEDGYELEEKESEGRRFWSDCCRASASSRPYSGSI